MQPPVEAVCQSRPPHPPHGLHLLTLDFIDSPPKTFILLHYYDECVELALTPGLLAIIGGAVKESGLKFFLPLSPLLGSAAWF